MLNLLLYFTYFFHTFYFDSADAAAYILPAQPKPPKFKCLQGCYQPDYDILLAYNYKFSPRDGKSCKQLTCNTDGSTSIYTCGVIDFPDYCTRVPGNLFLPYPDCCDGVSCPPKPSTTASTIEDQNPDPEATTPLASNDISNSGPPTETSTAKPTDSDETTDIPVSPPKCPWCLAVPKPPISKDENLPNSPPGTLPVEPPVTQPLEPTEPVIISNNNTDKPHSDPSTPPLNHGPVYHLPVEPPGGVSKVAEPNLEDPASTSPVKPPIDTNSAISQQNGTNSPLNRQPLRTLPVQPPVTVES